MKISKNEKKKYRDSPILEITELFQLFAGFVYESAELC